MLMEAKNARRFRQLKGGSTARLARRMAVLVRHKLGGTSQDAVSVLHRTPAGIAKRAPRTHSVFCFSQWADPRSSLCVLTCWLKRIPTCERCTATCNATACVTATPSILADGISAKDTRHRRGHFEMLHHAGGHRLQHEVEVSQQARSDQQRKHTMPK